MDAAILLGGDRFYGLVRWSEVNGRGYSINIWRDLGWPKAESMVPVGSGVRVVFVCSCCTVKRQVTNGGSGLIRDLERAMTLVTWRDNLKNRE